MCRTFAKHTEAACWSAGCQGKSTRPRKARCGHVVPAANRTCGRCSAGKWPGPAHREWPAALPGKQASDIPHAPQVTPSRSARRQPGEASAVMPGNLFSVRESFRREGASWMWRPTCLYACSDIPSGESHENLFEAGLAGRPDRRHRCSSRRSNQHGCRSGQVPARSHHGQVWCQVRCQQMCTKAPPSPREAPRGGQVRRQQMRSEVCPEVWRQVIK